MIKIQYIFLDNQGKFRNKKLNNTKIIIKFEPYFQVYLFIIRYLKG